MILPDMKKTPTGISPVISIDRQVDVPLYRQVYDAYRAAIVEGRIRTGERVPSTRVLATELGVSRIPILNAYAQLLAEGYFEARTSAGTVVSRSLPDQTPLQPRNNRSTKSQVAPRPISKRSSTVPSSQIFPRGRGWGAFGVGQVAVDEFPLRIWNSLIVRHCRNPTAKSFDYSGPMGSPELREAIASYLRTARAVRCEAEQIMIVSGSQQALEIASAVLLDSSDRVWLEEPGYRFARSVFALNGCEVVPVPVDDEGLIVAEGIKRCPKARAALVSPSHQYPLGVTMSASRRLQLIEWADTIGSWIIEDDYDSEYRYESLPIASLQGLDRNCRVIYIGTFSKVLYASLRLGYIVIPSDLIESFVSVRLAMDISPPGFFQSVLADFIREGHFSRHLRRMRLVYNERRATLMDVIKSEFGSSAVMSGGQAGMHLSLILKGISDHEVAQRAAIRNLWLTPLSSSYIGKPSQQGFILGFGSTSAESIPSAVHKLRSILKHH